MGKPAAPWSAERHFEGSVSSVAGARSFVTHSFSDAPPAVLEDALLIVSELAANAVAHARSAFTIRLAHAASSLRIEVRDHGGGVPTLRSPQPDETFGRGLSIVDKLARGWGFDPQPGGGKTVWVDIAFAAARRSGR
jgi:signal transduction histidine kinase